jgi:outer membrane receptor for ferrienterochelin and colicin
MDDDINEKFKLFKFNRREQVAGAFAELAINRKDKFNMVAGFRADYHNYYGMFYTPRLHLRYAFTQNSILRLSGGRALRTANIFADNAYLMASSRQWILKPSDLAMPYGLKPETGWNYGLNFTQRFKINYREAYITVDAYRTDFENQVVIDLDNDPQEISIYNLKGPSYSNTAQFEFNMEPRKRLFVKTAYRYVDTRVAYTKGLLQKPMVSTHRAFINFSYETRGGHWQFDFTTQYNGSKRLPDTRSNSVGHRRESNSPEFFNLLGQITYLAKLKRSEFHIYIGVENLLNYKQDNPILDAHSPYGKYFDASMVWGPIYGRMLYAGLRFKIKELTWLKFKEDK